MRRLHQRGYVASSECKLCSGEGTLIHRHPECLVCQERELPGASAVAARAAGGRVEAKVLLERCLWLAAQAEFPRGPASAVG
jgi:hypothetical protein